MLTYLALFYYAVNALVQKLNDIDLCEKQNFEVVMIANRTLKRVCSTEVWTLSYSQVISEITRYWVGTPQKMSSRESD